MHGLLFLSFLPASDDVEKPVEELERSSDVLHFRVLGERLFVERLFAVDPLDLLHDVRQTFLDDAHVAGVLGHHVRLQIVVEIVAALADLAQLGGDLHLLGGQQLLGQLAHRLGLLQKRTTDTFTHCRLPYVQLSSLSFLPTSYSSSSATSLTSSSPSSKINIVTIVVVVVVVVVVVSENAAVKEFFLNWSIFAKFMVKKIKRTRFYGPRCICTAADSTD